MDTSDKLEQKRDWFLDEVKKELKTSLRLYQIEPFVKMFFKHMIKNVVEISADQKEFIYQFFLILNSLIEKRKNLHFSSSSLQSKFSHFSPESRKYDLNICESIKGPLTGAKKFMFLKSVKNLMEDVFNTRALSKYERREWMVILCVNFCKLPRNLVLTWITSTKKN